MNKKIPHTPFSTALSRSAREIELRLRNIMSGPKKRPPLPFLILMFAVCIFCGNLVSCHVAENAPPDLSGPAASQQEWAVPGVQKSVVPGLERREGVYTFLLTASTGEGASADAFMVLCYDTGRQTAGMVSIPRDTLVEREGEAVRLYNVLNYPEQFIADISHMLGIPIDYHIGVDTNGFAALVDELGGIDFYIPCAMDYDDPSQDLSIHYEEGLTHLNGRQAMEVARFRKNNDGTSYSDLGRVQTQQQLMEALAKKLLSWNSMTKINSFVDIFSQNVETNLSMTDMLYFASQAAGMDLSSRLETTTLPTYDVAQGVFILGLEPDPEPTLAVVNRLLNPYTQDMTLENMDLVQSGQ